MVTKDEEVVAKMAIRTVGTTITKEEGEVDMNNAIEVVVVVAAIKKAATIIEAATVTETTMTMVGKRVEIGTKEMTGVAEISRATMEAEVATVVNINPRARLSKTYRNENKIEQNNKQDVERTR